MRKKEKEVDRCQREIDEFISCTEKKGDDILNRLLYPLDEHNRFSVDGQPLTWLAKYICITANNFLRENADYRSGVDTSTVKADVIGEIAVSMLPVLTEIKRNPEKVAAKWYFFLEKAVNNKVTSMKRAHLAKKREIDRRTTLLREDESLDDFYYKRLCGNTSVDWINEQEDGILNRLTVEAMINDESLTSREREVLVYMYETPGASHQEIGDELGMSRRTVTRIIQRLGEKLVHHVTY